jgi:hypothetical protein
MVGYTRENAARAVKSGRADRAKRMNVSRKATSGQQVVRFFGARGTLVMVLGAYTHSRLTLGWPSSLEKAGHAIGYSEANLMVNSLFAQNCN